MPLYQKIIVIIALIYFIVWAITTYKKLKYEEENGFIGSLISHAWFKNWIEVSNENAYLVNLLKENNIEIDLTKVNEKYMQDTYKIKVIIDEDKNEASTQIERKDLSTHE